MSERAPIDAPYRWEVHTETGRRILLDRIEALENGFAVEVRPLRRRDTTKQIGLYNGWIADISDHTGDDWRSIDKEIRRTFLPIKHEVVFGKSTPMLTEIRDLEKEQITVLLDRLSAYNGTHIGANLRDPAVYRKSSKTIATA